MLDRILIINCERLQELARKDYGTPEHKLQKLNP
jgi:hypothetical protein